jgi:hypothetical protein
MPLRKFAGRVLDSLARRLANRLLPPLLQAYEQAQPPAGHAMTSETPLVTAPVAAPGGQVISIDYSVTPRPRWGEAWGLGQHEPLVNVVRSYDQETLASVETILGFKDALRAVPEQRMNDKDPYWINGWIPGWDGAALYGFTASRQPKRYVEVGSGNSTKFVRRAINDWKLKTTITSIDPYPRAEIDGLCDQIIRQPLESVGLELFGQLSQGDICFIDNSHRSFQNSDVTVSMLEILPRLKPGVLLGLHDIFLPDDYPQDWADRYYNEQYLLASYLLGGHLGTEIVLPAFDASRRPEFASRLNAIWDLPSLQKVERHGGGFWLLTT